MSKSKSVSDIMNHMVVFPNGREQSLSATFEVRNHPVILKAYNMGCDTVGHIEMGHHDGCGGWTWTPFSPVCDQLLLVTCSNVVVITVPGWYRVVFRNRITGELETGLDDLLVTVVETDMPVSMLAQYGGSTMACGNRVSVHPQENGCVIINVDDVPYTICPGSQVSCSPEGGGVIINGVLCPFPEPVSARVEGNCLLLTIGSEVIQFCDTNTDTNSVTIASIDATTGAVTITNPDGSEIVFDGRNSVTLASIDEDGLVTITNPDGSTVQFNGNDSITIASIDAAARVVTIVNPDGSEISFPYVDELPDPGTVVSMVENGVGDYTITVAGEDYDLRQTRVTRGTGTRENTQTLTANHQTTWPNTVWRETWMERIGSIVMINSWNPITNEWDAVAIEAPENLVILNNPVIYIDADNGQANPPINTQADLTLANAFNSFSSVRTFMTRTLLVGNVTLDCRGDFSLPGRLGMGDISSTSFKNAAQITVRGNPTDPTVFKVPCGGTGGRATAVSSSSGGTIVLRDFTLVALNEATGAIDGAGYFFSISGSGQFRINGTIRFEGFYDTDRAGASDSSVFRMSGGGSVYVSYDTVLQFDFDAGTKLSDLFSVGTGGVLTIHSNVEAQIARDIRLDGVMFSLQSGGNVLMAGSPGREIPWHYSGLGKFITNFTLDIRDLGIGNLAPNIYGARPASQLHDFGAVVAPGGAQAVTRIAAVGVLNNIAGP